MLNKAVLMGRLGADPEVRRLNSGAPVVSLRVATSERWTDKNTGEKKERTEWHQVVIFNEPLCKVAEQYLKKGHLVYLEGQIATRKWQDQAGQDRYSTEIVLRPYNGELKLLPQGGSGERAPAADSPDAYGRETSREPARPQPEQRQSFSQELDDEIPF